MYYYGYNSGYSYGSPNSCCGAYNSYPQYGYGGNNGGAIILVLFILLVIVIGARLVNN